MGRVVAVCIGPGGIPKHTVSIARVSYEGLEGDGHRYEEHGGEARAVCLLSENDVKALRFDGVVPGEFGQFGENLRIDGLDFASLRPGDKLSIGCAPGAGVAAGRVLLEITDVRSPCQTLKAIDPRLPDLMLGRSGFLARVLEEGELAPGMVVDRIGFTSIADTSKGGAL